MLLVEEKIFQDKTKNPLNIRGFFYFLYFSNLFFKSSGLNPKISNKIITNSIITKKERAKATGIQRGEVTHHQDQSIFPVSLRTKNTTNRTADKLRPLPVFFFVDIIYYIPNLSNKLFLF